MAFTDSLSNFWSGSPGSNQQLSTLSPQQSQLQTQLIDTIGPLLKNAGQNKFDFAPIAEQARYNFNTKTIPSIASRFASFGEGALGTPMARHGLSSAGGELDRNLGALQAQFGLQQQGQNNQLLTSLLGQALQPRSENIFTQGSGGFGGSVGEGAGAGAGTFALSALLRILKAFGVPLPF